MDAPDADQVVEQVQAGDREAFQRLFEAFYAPLRIAVAVRAPDPELVDEVVQETFVTAFERIRDYERRGTFFPWLIGIARNRLARALRERSARGRFDDDLALRLTADADDGGWDDLALAQRVRRCLERLAPAARELAAWRFAERQAVSAIAGRLGRSAASVSVSLHRVRSALRACLGGDAHA